MASAEATIKRLIEATNNGEKSDTLVEGCASKIVECAKIPDFYKLPFSVFQHVISKTEIIPADTITAIFEGAVKAYYSLAYCLLPLVDCGKIGPQKALQAISALTEAPLIHEIAQFPTVQKQEIQKLQQQMQQKPAPAPVQPAKTPTYRQQPARTSQPAKSSQSVKSQAAYNGSSRIVELCESGRIEEVRRIIREQPNAINAVNKFGDRPIHKAVWGTHYELVKFLLASGADPNVADNEGFTPLHKAVSKKSYDITKLLIENGADVSASTHNGVTPLFTAAGNGQSNICGLLLSEGAEVNCTTHYLDTPLHLAAKNGYADVCLMLLTQGANPNAKNNRRETPLDVTSNQRIREMLIKYGSN